MNDLFAIVIAAVVAAAAGYAFAIYHGKALVATATQAATTAAVATVVATAPTTVVTTTSATDVKPAARVFLSNLEVEVASFFAKAKADVEKL